MSTFALCVYGGQRAIKYYHDYGEFEFLLLKAEDGSSNIRFASTHPLNQGSIDTVGREAMGVLEKTALTFKVEIRDGIITFEDAINILKQAQKHSSRLKQLGHM